jgi:integrase/recombinase XerD
MIVGTGCRLTEALGLDWGPDGLDLRADPPVARIRRETTKTDAGVRDVMLARETAAILREHYLASGCPEGAPVFANTLGRPAARDNSVRRGILRVAKAAGLPGVSPHVLRHAHATWLGASPAVSSAAAARRLGHADATFFQRRCVHPGEADDATALTGFEEYRSAHRAQ